MSAVRALRVAERSRPDRIVRGLVVVALSLPLVTATAGARAQTQGLTLEEALREARAANARLPVAALEVAAAQERVREAKARRGPRVSVEAGLRYAPPPAGYGVDLNGENLQAVLSQPLYAGGAIDARVRVDEEELSARRAVYRVEEKDVELEVRVHFARWSELEASLAPRRDGLHRLGSYVTYLEQRQAAGQPVTVDVLKTRARQISESANVIALERQLAEISLELGDLLGRALETSLAIAPMAEPPAPAALLSQVPSPWQATPDVRAAAGEVRAATANVDVVSAEGKPRVSATIDAGLFGLGVGGTPSWARPADRLRNDAGVSAGVTLSWVVFDLGVVSSQIAEARIARDSRAQSLVAVERHARLERARARAVLVAGYDELQARARAVPVARDAYLEAESVYRGGAGTALDVLDSYVNWIASSDAYQSTLFEYRVAEALLERWGTK